MKNNYFFNELDQNILDEIMSTGDRVVYERNGIIYDKGAPASHLYLLEKGDVDLIDKDVIRLSLKSSGDLFGWSSLVKNGIFTTTAISKTISSVIRIPRESINDIFDRNPDIALHFYKHLGFNFSKQMGKIKSKE